jgi:hypothetical protein
MNSEQPTDSLVDEVRQIRAQVAEQFGNDLDKLVAHLREVEHDYAERRGIYAGIDKEAARRVEKSWGDLSGPADEPIIDEIREIRRKLAANSPKE